MSRRLLLSKEAFKIVQHSKSVVYSAHTFSEFRYLRMNCRFKDYTIALPCKGFREISLDRPVVDGINDIDYVSSFKQKIDFEEENFKKLLASSTVEDVFNALDDSALSIKKEYIVQALYMLYSLFKAFNKVHVQTGQSIENMFIRKLHEHERFKDLLRLFEVHLDLLDIEDLSRTFFYLTQLGVDQTISLMQTILNKLEDALATKDFVITLDSLSQICVALRSNYEIRNQLSQLKIVPIIVKKIDTTKTTQELLLLTICVTQMIHLMPISAIERYTKLCDSFAETSALSENPSTALKILSVLAMPSRSHCIMSTLRKIAEGINVKKLPIKDMILLSKVFHNIMEPASLGEKMNNACNDYVSTSTLPESEMNIPILSCIAELGNYVDKVKLENSLLKEIKSDHFENNVVSLFQVLRSLKTSDKALCDLFWSKTCDVIQISARNRDTYNWLSLALRYMYFNNNMGGTYRHHKFEKCITRLILEEMEWGSSRYTPIKLARCVSFLIAYCTNREVITSAIDLILGMRSQLDKVDCILLSRGMEIMLEFTKRKNVHSDVMRKLAELDTALNDCAWRHVKEESLDIAELNSLLRAFANRRASADTLLFHTLAKRIENCSDPLSSRLIRDISFSLSTLNYLIPSVMDKMIAYVVQNENSVMAELAERVLTSSFHSGYQPSIKNSFLQTCERLLLRDKDRLSSLSIIQICLALGFYQKFRADLAGFVFSVEFLERIDEELSNCYSKAVYPIRVRYALMELNRCVCLDIPELDIPWFHAKYCEEIAALDPSISTPFHDDVRNHLLNIVKGDQYLQNNVYSPYGHKINFLVLLDKRTKPLMRHEGNNAKDKVAIVLHSEHQFTSGVRILKGQQQLRQRHLEMMGFRVVPIAEHEWNAMYLSEHHAKRSFLESTLWPER